MSKEETEKVGEIISEGVAREGLGDVVVPAEEGGGGEKAGGHGEREGDRPDDRRFEGGRAFRCWTARMGCWGR